MSHAKKLAALETDISRARARAKELGLSFLAQLLLMAHLELAEHEPNYGNGTLKKGSIPS